MPIIFEGNMARFDGACAAEEALELIDWLRVQQSPTIDLQSCAHLHTALLQVLFAANPRITRPPLDEFLRQWVFPKTVPDIPERLVAPLQQMPLVQPEEQ